MYFFVIAIIANGKKPKEGQKRLFPFIKNSLNSAYSFASHAAASRGFRFCREHFETIMEDYISL